MPINETHDPNLKSWVESANDPKSDFPIQNLPLCSFLRAPHGSRESRGLGVIIGDQILDLLRLWESEVVGRDFGTGIQSATDAAIVHGTTTPLLFAKPDEQGRLRR